MIKITEAQNQRRIKLNEITWARPLTDSEISESEFLYLLFKFEQKDKTKEDLKKYINKLYSANKQIQQAHKNKEGLSNYLVDILAIEDILQNNKNVLYSFFKLSYSYLKECQRYNNI